MLHILKEQYNLISSTRETLFSFLEEIPLEKLHSTVPNFGSGSIIKTHIHVADCYRYWLGSFAFKQKKEPWSTTPLWLLTHTETHEFHHKGQIVSMARHLGYNPPDTDLS
ncbi:hypothetical protein OCA08_16075 [Bacillus cereus]|nr:hypothetical protein [Bacillus cereus]